VPKKNKEHAKKRTVTATVLNQALNEEQRVIFACEACAKDIDRVRAHMTRTAQQTVVTPLLGFW
jgi:predicted RNA-binding Zn-ribbon protein involved in translation (DUF1610 family)